MTDALLLRAAATLGLTRSALRGPAWRCLSHGLYQRSDLAGHDLARLYAMRQVLPACAAWSHYTGARHLGLWLPPLPARLPLFATVPPGTTRPERAGLYVARSRARSFEPVVVHGVETLPAPLLLGQLAEDLALVDLVVAVDSALHLRWCSPEEVLEAISPRQRASARRSRALTLADDRSESAYETVLRLFHVLCGFDVTPQHKVLDDDGRVVARADLRINGTSRLPEYDGADHRDRQRHHADLRRDKVLARLGLDRYGYTRDEIVRTPTRLLRDAEEACGMPHDPRRLRAWLVELGRSSLNPQGRRRLDARLCRYANCRSASPASNAG